eukprot:6161387-Amphidinium_carterae.1
MRRPMLKKRRCRLAVLFGRDMKRKSAQTHKRQYPQQHCLIDSGAALRRRPLTDSGAPVAEDR